jgi:hypothetical protein
LTAPELKVLTCSRAEVPALRAVNQRTFGVPVRTDPNLLFQTGLKTLFALEFAHPPLHLADHRPDLGVHSSVRQSLIFDRCAFCSEMRLKSG